MEHRAFVVHATADEDGAARMTLAAGLAREAGALLTGVAVRDIVPPLTAPAAGPVIVAALVTAQQQEIEAELDAAEREFRAIADRGGLRTAWRGRIDSPATALAREARAADLVIIGRRPERGRAGFSASVEPGDVIMQAGRPVLLVPPGVDHLDATRVVVAWKDTRESRRAVADALPFLRRANSVLVLQICRNPADADDAAASTRDVAAYLACHGVEAATEARPLREATVAAELLLAAERHGAGLVVTGAYGHSRLQERVFGGVTRSLLRDFPKCCLLSH